MKKPKVKKSSVSSSDGDDDESDDDDDESDDSDENVTSSEADESTDDNDDNDVGKMRKRTPNAATNSAFVVSASANAALKRFVASTERIDGDTAPLGSHRFLTQAKQTLNECKSLHDLLDGSHSISEENVNEILLRVCTAADSLASASLAVQNVDVEIEAFRRLSQTLYSVWEATMPQMERLDDAILKASHGVANASRIASELFTSQLTLARTVSSSLEGIMQRSSCENGSDTSLTSFTSWATRQSPRESE